MTTYYEGAWIGGTANVTPFIDDSNPVALWAGIGRMGALENLRRLHVSTYYDPDPESCRNEQFKNGDDFEWITNSILVDRLEVLTLNTFGINLTISHFIEFINAHPSLLLRFEQSSPYAEGSATWLLRVENGTPTLQLQLNRQSPTHVLFRNPGHAGLIEAFQVNLKSLPTSLTKRLAIRYDLVWKQVDLAFRNELESYLATVFSDLEIQYCNQLSAVIG